MKTPDQSSLPRPGDDENRPPLGSSGASSTTDKTDEELPGSPGLDGSVKGSTPPCFTPVNQLRHHPFHPLNAGDNERGLSPPPATETNDREPQATRFAANS